jgi:uncharacterized membrane protein YidH (DUF202 family)
MMIVGRFHDPRRDLPGETSMRIEVISAFAFGTALPILETARRGFGHWTENVTTMFEDYLAGAFLLIAGLAAVRARSYSRPLLLGAWAYVTGMMGSSFWYQLEETIRGQDLEPNNSAVLAVKALLWVTAVASLVCSYRQLIGIRAE